MLASEILSPPLTFRSSFSVLLLGPLLSPASAEVVVSDSILSYENVSNVYGIQNEHFDFTTYNGSYQMLEVDAQSRSHEISASSGLRGVPGSYLQTEAIGESLIIDFEGENVRSVGGFFFLVDDFNFPSLDLLELEMSDGTSFISLLKDDGSFVGFTSSDASIQRLRLKGIGFSCFAASAVSSLVVGVVPSPAGLALLGVAGIFHSRRRID